MDADTIIATLGLAPHPEGGWFRETHRSAASTAIYFLLRRGERSHWHRVRNAEEAWHWYCGAPLALRIHQEMTREVCLGPDLTAGQRPQAVVPVDAWQSAETLGDWTLVGCTVAPPFDFAAFELAPPGWAPDLGEAG